MLIYANLCKYHRQTYGQTNTSKVQFGTSQNIITHLDRTFKETKNDIKNGKKKF